MSLRLYMDQHIPGAATAEIRRQGVFVLTAEEDGNKHLADPALLDRAAFIQCVLVTQDRDLLVEASRRQRLGVYFSGIVYSHQLQITIGQLVEDLVLMAEVYDREDIVNRVERLPLK